MFPLMFPVLLYETFKRGLVADVAIRLVTFPILYVGIFVRYVLTPQYIELREDGLFLRRGWKKDLIPYAAVVSIQPLGPQLRIATRERKKFSMFELADEARFKAEIANRCPHLRPRRFGLEALAI
jgi:hypothetical protein